MKKIKLFLFLFVSIWAFSKATPPANAYYFCYDKIKVLSAMPEYKMLMDEADKKSVKLNQDLMKLNQEKAKLEEGKGVSQEEERRLNNRFLELQEVYNKENQKLKNSMNALDDRIKMVLKQIAKEENRKSIRILRIDDCSEISSNGHYLDSDLNLTSRVIEELKKIKGKL